MRQDSSSIDETCGLSIDIGHCQSLLFDIRVKQQKVWMNFLEIELADLSLLLRMSVDKKSVTTV